MAPSDLPSPPLFRRRLEPPPFPLIDVHAYVGEPMGGGLYGRLVQEEVAGWMDEARVEHVCAFVPQRARYAEANGDLRAWADGTDGRVLPLARLGGAGGPRPIRGIGQAKGAVRAALRRQEEEAVDLDGFAGVLLRPHTDGMPPDAVFREIACRASPVIVHAGEQAPPGWIAQHILPKTTGPVILQHLGAYPGDAHLLREAVALAEREPRVFLDIGVPSLAPFVRFAARRVPEHVLFGSGMPVLHPATAWAHVAAALPGDDGLLRAIGRDNAARLFSLDLDA